ncbi:TPA: hypothetical protein H2C15_004578 [Salmonella enterica]|nr:hypothetical protein [Salmonella enterica]
MKRPFRPFRPFLDTIKEEQDTSIEIPKHTTSKNPEISKTDFNQHRQNLFGPHKYVKKHSRDDPANRYSLDRTSEGFHAFVKQQREKTRHIANNNDIKSTTKELVEYRNEINDTQISKNSSHPSSRWSQWSSPKIVMTPEEINNNYGLRIQKWDSRKYKEDLINNALKPITYHTKHAIGDKTKRFSYENSSEGFREFLKSKKNK